MADEGDSRFDYPADLFKDVLEEGRAHLPRIGASWNFFENASELWNNGQEYWSAVSSGDLCDFAGTAASAFAVGGSALGLIGVFTVNPAIALAGAGLAAGGAALSAIAEVVRNEGGCGLDVDPFKLPFNDPPVSPLIIDMDGGAVEVTALATSTVHFDIDGDGFAEKTAWITGGDGFLAIDRNADGEINNINELFGSETQDGFSQLVEFDSNSDGLINSSDTDFDLLRVWIDENSDGVSQENELKSLASSEIASITATGAQIDEVNNGNPVTHRGTVTFTDSTTSNVDDVWFQNDQSSTQELLPDGFEMDPEALRLPQLVGEGGLSDLRVAMSRDGTLLDLVKDLVMSADDLTGAEFRDAVEEIVLSWSGANAADPEGRGDYMNGQHLAVLEAVFGEQYMQTQGTNAGTSNPGPSAGHEMENQYQDYIDAFVTRIAAQVLPSQIDYITAGEMSAQVLVDGDFFGLFSVTYNEFRGEVGVWELGKTFANIGEARPTDVNEAITYFEKMMTLLRGVQLDVFLGDETAFLAAVNAGMADIPDAWRAYAVSLLSGANIVEGTASADVIDTGAEVRDELVRNLDGTANVIVGGAGDDHLTGRTGGDSYLYRIGDGADVIEDLGAGDYDQQGNITAGYYAGNRGGTDRLLLLDINRSDIEIVRAGSDLVITLTNSPGDSITIRDHFGVDGLGGIEEVVTADATLTAADIDLMLSPRVTTTGSEFSQVVTGTTGNDLLDGGEDTDLYLFGPGSGEDTIIRAADAATSNDEIQVNFASTQMFIAVIDDDLVLRFFDDVVDANGNTRRELRDEMLTIKDQMGFPTTIQTILFNDGVTYTADDLQNLWFEQDTQNIPYAFEDVVLSRGDGTTAQESDLVGTVNGVVVFTFEDHFYQRWDFDWITFWQDGYPQTLSFADGTVLTKDDIAALVPLIGTSGDDNLRSSSASETIDGGAGNDILNAGDGDDILVGGLGDDLLFGDIEVQPDVPLRVAFDGEPLIDHAGSDTFVYSSGDGNDTVIDRGAGGLDTDRLILSDLNADEVTITRVLTARNDLDHTGAPLPDSEYFSEDLLIHITATGQIIRIVDQFYDDLRGLEFLQFADGSTLDRDQLFELAPLTGNEGGGTVLEGRGVIDASIGFEHVQGTSEDDTLLFGASDGGGFLRDPVGSNQTAAGIETVRLKDINASELSLSRDDLDLVFHIAGADSTLTIEGYFDPEISELRQIRFANGEIWTTQRILAEAAVDGSSLDDVLSGTADDDVMDGGEGDDTLNGAAGDDTIMGGVGEDTLVGASGNDRFVVVAGDGADSIDGGADSDTYDASATDVALNANLTTGSASIATTTDTLTSVENLVGGRGNDTLTGSSQANTLSGGRGSDTLAGMDGDDVLEGGAGSDTMNGGNGTDAASYRSSLSGVTVSLNTGTGTGGDAFGDTLTSIESVFGSNYSDSITGNGSANILNLASGNDIASGLAGADVISGGRGNDEISGDEGNDRLTGDEGSDQLFGGAGNDTLEGGKDLDVLTGGTGSDEYIWTKGDGDDTVAEAGGTGGDVDTLTILGYTPSEFRIESYRGDIFLTSQDGETITLKAQLSVTSGAGVETVLFDDSTSWNRAYLASHAVEQGNGVILSVSDDGFLSEDGAALIILAADLLANDRDLDGDALTIASLQSGLGGAVQLTSSGDILFTPTSGFSGEATFTYTVSDGFGGAATSTVRVAVTDSDPTITGTAGSDVLVGDAQNNTLSGLGGDDELSGSAGDDILIGGSGGDVLDGGDGFDVASYETASAGIYFHSGDPIQNTGDAAGDTFAGIEGLRGSAFDDEIIVVEDSPVVWGGAGGDLITIVGLGSTVYGEDGDDGIYASAAVDVVDGGSGNDQIFGYEGADHLILGDGDDYAIGGEDADLIEGGEGSDTMFGGAGNDSLFGGNGDDELQGDDGDDVLEGGSGDDWLVGGSGNDTFIFTGGDDGIADFEAHDGLTNGDVIELHDQSVSTFLELMDNATQGDEASFINLDDGAYITLYGVTLDQLSASDFRFA